MTLHSKVLEVGSIGIANEDCFLGLSILIVPHIVYYSAFEFVGIRCTHSVDIVVKLLVPGSVGEPNFIQLLSLQFILEELVGRWALVDQGAHQLSNDGEYSI